MPEDFAVSLYPLDLTDGGPALTGWAADLTMGGIGVVLPEAIDPALHCEMWAVSFVVPDKTGRQIPLTLTCLITHGRPQPNGQLYGFKFTEINAPLRSTERAALRQYLLSDLRDEWQGNLMLRVPSVMG
jgi:c-di-GMP-binding flagellar brake protein YcgR